MIDISLYLDVNRFRVFQTGALDINEMSCTDVIFKFRFPSKAGY